MEIENNRVRGKFTLLLLAIISFSSLLEYYFTVKGNNYTAFLVVQLIPIILFLLNFFYSNKQVTHFKLYVLCIFCMMLVMALISLYQHPSELIYAVSIYIQIGIAIFWGKLDVDYFQRLFKILAILGSILFVYAIIGVGVNTYNSVNMLYVNSEFSYISTTYWAVIPAMIFSIITGKNIKWSSLYWIESIIINIIIQKRFILVDSLMILIFICIFYLKKNQLTVNQLIKYLLVLIVIFVAGSVMYISFLEPMVSHLFVRVSSTATDIGDFDRFVEAKNYFKQSGIINNLIGGGMAATHSGLGKVSYALHVGWCNFILKGGIFLLVIPVLGTLKAIRLVGHFGELTLEKQCSVILMLIYSIRLIYSNMHAIYPEMLIYYVCLFQLFEVPISEWTAINLEK